MVGTHIGNNHIQTKIQKAAYFKQYYSRNLPLFAEKQRRLTLRSKQLVYDYYGSICNCCGESEPKFLSIDHVQNDGYKERKSRGGSTQMLYRNIIKQNFPPTYQILCMNCNTGKSRNNGICPHIT